MIPFALGAAVMPEQADRECFCPKWVQRCIHFEGRWLALHPCPPPTGGWAVCFGAEPPEYMAHADGHKSQAGGSIFVFEADALAAFEAEEARLLGREVPS